MKDIRRLSTQTLNANQFTHGHSLEACIKCGKQTLGRASLNNNTAVCAGCYAKEQVQLGHYGSMSSQPSNNYFNSYQ